MPDPLSALRPTRRPPLRAHPDGRAWPTSAWPTSEPVAGTDLERLDALLAEAFDGPHPQLGDTLAYVAVHGGCVVAERYGSDVDEASPLLSWSMAKSVTQALVGVLVQDGLLDLDAPAPVPEWSAADDPRRVITTRQLLAMSSGLRFSEDYDPASGVSDVLQMLFGTGMADMAGFAASLPLDHEPGSVCSYSSGTTNIVSGIVGRIVGGGEPGMRRFMRERLFEPLGMTTADPRFDDAGTFTGSSYLHASARDFARFGYLFLRDGVWDGDRLLPRDWVEYTRSPVATDPGEAFWYGSHWWLWDDEIAGFGAHGYEGQFVVVVPERDLVAVRLAKTPEEHKPVGRSWMRDTIACFPPR